MKNTFINGIEPSKQQAEQQFTPTKKDVMDATIGRDSKEFTRRSMPIFENSPVHFYQPHIAFMHTLIKSEKRPF